ncbi:MAG: Asp-tRNA(Asn)/Glu-tRNA(Gln) amidotransferase subunit GatA [Clostridiales bacterium]|nr:Asp-tRNA(Asn)/Glu-tRNA(Gln) amidotransferase subunit GatA [Clostridiales bacterium]
MKLIDYSVCQLSELLKSRKISSRELTEAYLEQIEKREGEVGAFITLCANEARKKADQIDKMRASGEKLTPLAGIPMGLKDNICTKNLKTTCASKFLEDFVPPYDATVTEKLSDSILLGKLNMDEFAMGSTTETSALKKTCNPRNINYVPGGSSGGSAAAVAAQEAAFTLGTDTGGSIRQPAAFCGVVGMKPTYGSVSRYGAVAFASSFDQIGPITRNVRDSAAVLSAIAGQDPRDSTSVNKDYSDIGAQIGKEIKGMRIGLLREFFEKGAAEEIRTSVLSAAKKLESLGAEIVDLSMPSLDYALPTYYVISASEASSNLAKFDGIGFGTRAKQYEDIYDLYCRSRSEGFGAEVKRRIMLGTFALSAGYYDAYYKKALCVRALIINEFKTVFEKCDVILSPTTPTTAYKIGEKCADPIAMYMGDIYTIPVNIAGLPAISIPCGCSASGLPIATQLIGKAFAESTLYRVAAALEDELGDYDTILMKAGIKA